MWTEGRKESSQIMSRLNKPVIGCIIDKDASQLGVATDAGSRPTTIALLNRNAVISTTGTGPTLSV